jgi:hypothetical protein
MKKLATVAVLLALTWTLKPLVAQKPAGRVFSVVNQCLEYCPGEACCHTSTGWVCC